MIKSLMLMLLFGFPATIFAQETITVIDGKQHQATPPWNFICENYALSGIVTVQVGKSDKGGILQLSIQTTNPTFYIGGTVYIDLEDHTVVVCTDKNIRQTSSGNTTAWYAFSAAEMARLKKTNISGIRFYIKGTQQRFSSQTGNFTALNKKSHLSLPKNTIQTYLTASEISSLYN